MAGRKHYDPDIYRTDWQGGKPVFIAEGYAVDCWRDESTGVEWVYAARKFKSNTNSSLEAARLVRFKLDNPASEEIVYDDGPITPDNIQLSRDGSQASCLFPWPNAGVLIRGKDGKYHARKLQTGCWPSHSPDNSHVSWVFDGSHRGAAFFSDGGKKSWPVKFNQGEGMRGGEMYHPRWSNHPRYLALTGPYLPVKNASGSRISKGGASANVYLGRFSENLDKVEAWLQITHDKLNESFPDVWIEGADEAQLAAFPTAEPAAGATSQAEAWPVIKDRLVFLSIFGVAIHARALKPAEAKQQSLSQLARLSQLPPAPRRLKVRARLLETSAMPSAEGIAPYTGALLACVYEPEKVLEGELSAKRILVKHWAMLGQKTVTGFPRKTGASYDLILEAETDHPHLQGERVMDDTTAFDLESCLMRPRHAWSSRRTQLTFLWNKEQFQHQGPRTRSGFRSQSSSMTSSHGSNRLTGAIRTGLTVVAVLFLLKVALYLDSFREGFMWPFRILTVAAVLWLLYARGSFRADNEVRAEEGRLLPHPRLDALRGAPPHLRGVHQAHEREG